MEYIISLLLLALSALFSGLTLGLLSLDIHTLRRQSELGNEDAIKLFPIRKEGNLLLSTLLLSNVAVNTALAVFLGSIASGVVAGVLATTLIFLFGEIIPQAVISRYALWFGAQTAWFVRILIIVLYPLTFPIAYSLDRLLGKELPTFYSKNELMQIISEHEDSEESPIDEDEERILHGALMFSHRRVSEVMTPLNQVVMYDEKQILDKKFREEMAEKGFSRYPVYRNKQSKIVGILYTKDVLMEPRNVAVGKAEEAFETNFLEVSSHEMLDTLLTRMLKRKLHMGIVLNNARKCIGVVTLEDIIEEIIQQEIEDEDD
jgi:metal transporter CNNM